MNNKSILCPTCGLNEKDQHSNRTSGWCDFLRRMSWKSTDSKGEEALKILKAGRKVVVA